MYSLWLLENCYNPPPSVTNQQIPTEPQEITVAMARFSPRRRAKSGDNKKDKSVDKQNEMRDETDPDDDKRRKRKKKKKKKKRDEVDDGDSVDGVMPLSDNRVAMDHWGVQGTGRLDQAGVQGTGRPDQAGTPAGKHKRQDPRKLSFHLPHDSPDDQRSVG